MGSATEVQRHGKSGGREADERRERGTRAGGSGNRRQHEAFDKPQRRSWNPDRRETVVDNWTEGYSWDQNARWKGWKNHDEQTDGSVWAKDASDGQPPGGGNNRGGWTDDSGVEGGWGDARWQRNESKNDMGWNQTEAWKWKGDEAWGKEQDWDSGTGGTRPRSWDVPEFRAGDTGWKTWEKVDGWKKENERRKGGERAIGGNPEWK